MDYTGRSAGKGGAKERAPRESRGCSSEEETRKEEERGINE